MLRLLLVTLFLTTAYSNYIHIDPSDGSFEIPVVCTSGYYDLVNASGSCKPCDKNTFQSSYGAEALGDEIGAAYRHGRCCENTHHHVCAKLLEEWQNRCGADLCPRAVNATDSI